MKPVDQARRRNSPSVIDCNPRFSWKDTISRTASSCSRCKLILADGARPIPPSAIGQVLRPQEAADMLDPERRII